MHSAVETSEEQPKIVHETLYTVQLRRGRFGINKEATLFDLRRHIQMILHLGDKESLFLVCGSLIPNTNQKIRDL